jgi:hypothetical protein
MADGGANQPAARVLWSPASSRESGVSGARLATPKPYVVPPTIGTTSDNATPPPSPAPPPAESRSPLAAVPNDAAPPALTEQSVPSLAQLRSESSAAEESQPAVASAWGEFATAPTLLLTPPGGPEPDDAASTSRIATPSAPPLEHQPWYRTGTTMPPPSMRPPAESAPAIRNAPSPRVLKIVAGVIGGCLFIVAIAGAKILYKWATAEPIASVAETAGPARPADPPSAVAAPPQSTAPAATPTEILPAAPAAAVPAPAPAPEIHRAPARPNTPRTPVKPAPRRAPVPKKVVKGTR